MPMQTMDLFHAYNQNKIPAGGGYIVAVTHRRDGAAVYTVAKLDAVDSVESLAQGLAIRARGESRLFRIAAPSSPGDGGRENSEESGADETRAPGEIQSLPLDGILTVNWPTARDCAFLFPKSAASLSALQSFLAETFIAEARLSPPLARQAADEVAAGLRRSTQGSL